MMSIALIIYLWVLLTIYSFVVAKLVPHPREGFDLVWRAVMAPVLIPFLVIARLIKGTRA
jgi:hypothetical protein